MKQFIISILFLFGSLNVFSQVNALKLPAEPLEQVLLTTDRDLYISGEKIWFSSDCILSDDEHIMSKILYIELYSENKTFKCREKYSIKNGQAFGSLEIPQNFKSGNYFLRTYTQYQKNYPPEFYTTKLITIINPNVALSKDRFENLVKEIKIIPNDGLILEEIENKIAYFIPEKLFENYKKFEILDQEQKVILSKECNKNYGVLTLFPNKDQSYTFNLISNNLDTIVQELPHNSKHGMIINSRFKENNLKINIVNKSNLKSNGNHWYITVRSDDFTIEFSKRIRSTIMNYTIDIPGDILNSGINYILLEDENRKVIKSSSVYVQNNSMSLNIKNLKEEYGTREKVSIDIDKLDLGKNPPIKYTLSVVKKGSLYDLKQLLKQGVLEPQVLASYLKFTNINQVLESDDIAYVRILLNSKLNEGEYIANLNLNSEKELQWLPETRDVSVSGYVYDKQSKKALPNLTIYASVFNNDPQFHFSKTNAEGEFIVSINNLRDKQDVYLMADAENRDNVAFRINNDFSNSFSKIKEIPLFTDTSKRILLEEMYVNFQTGKSFNTETGSQKESNNIIPYCFSDPQVSIVLDDYISSPNLETAIKEIVPSVKLHKSKDQYSLTILNYTSLKTYRDPLILVDNIPIKSVNNMLSIPISNIVKIDVYRKPLILGDYTLKGIFNLYTNTDDFGGMDMPKGSIFFEYQTISPSYIFDPQTYASTEQNESNLADYRNLLYWEPNLSSENNNKLTFYTSDHKSEYDIIIRGYSKSGKQIFYQSSITVK